MGVALPEQPIKAGLVLRRRVGERIVVGSDFVIELHQLQPKTDIKDQFEMDERALATLAFNFWVPFGEVVSLHTCKRVGAAEPYGFRLEAVASDEGTGRGCLRLQHTDRTLRFFNSPQDDSCSQPITVWREWGSISPISADLAVTLLSSKAGFAHLSIQATMAAGDVFRHGKIAVALLLVAPGVANLGVSAPRATRIDREEVAFRRRRSIIDHN